MQAGGYRALLGLARRHARRAGEAEDLLQSTLLAAIEAGRGDLDRIENRRWIAGVLRRRAAFEARSAVRRRRREEVQAGAAPMPSAADAPISATRIAAALPPALRTTALLALAGHDRREIAWLLRLNDAALRRRIADIRKRLRTWGGTPDELPGLSGPLAYGRIRRALLKPAQGDRALLASHDPDGNLFLLSSRNEPARQHIRANPMME